MRGIVRTTAAVAAVILVLIITASIITGVLPLILVEILHGDHRPIPTDAEMIAHFKSNEAYFEQLRQMIEGDSLSYIPLFHSDIRDSVTLPISVDRQAEYGSLMKKTNVEHISLYGYPSGDHSIEFNYFSKGDATWGIDKGFRYVSRIVTEQNSEFTKKELFDVALDEASKHGHSLVDKRINDHWELFILYDR